MNELKLLADFQKVLSNYRVSDKNKAILNQTRLVLLDGPTSSGRNTIIDELVKTGEYYHIVSDTTRQPRHKDGISIEKNGREYWFRSEEEVLDGLKRGDYMEAAIIHNQQVSGCNIVELQKANATGKIAVKDIEPQGARSIHVLKPDAIFPFILPPHFEEWLRRIEQRSTLPLAEKRRRFRSAVLELDIALNADYYLFVLNDSVASAAKQIEAIVRGDIDENYQKKYQEIAKQLQEETRKFLDKAE